MNERTHKFMCPPADGDGCYPSCDCWCHPALPVAGDSEGVCTCPEWMPEGEALLGCPEHDPNAAPVSDGQDGEARVVLAPNLEQLERDIEFSTAPAPVVVPQGETEALAQTLFETAWGAATSTEHAERFIRSDWLAARVRAAQQEARAEALREAANGIEGIAASHGLMFKGFILEWLRARADALSTTDGGGTDG